MTEQCSVRVTGIVINYIITTEKVKYDIVNQGRIKQLYIIRFLDLMCTKFSLKSYAKRTHTYFLV